MEDKIREAAMKMGKPEDMPATVINVAMDAWRDLAKQKMMVALDRTSGPALDKTAAITVAYLNEFWMSAMQGKELPRARTDEFVEALTAASMGK